MVLPLFSLGDSVQSKHVFAVYWDVLSELFTSLHASTNFASVACSVLDYIRAPQKSQQTRNPVQQFHPARGEPSMQPEGLGSCSAPAQPVVDKPALGPKAFSKLREAWLGSASGSDSGALATPPEASSNWWYSSFGCKATCSPQQCEKPQSVDNSTGPDFSSRSISPPFTGSKRAFRVTR